MNQLKSKSFPSLFYSFLYYPSLFPTDRKVGTSRLINSNGKIISFLLIYCHNLSVYIVFFCCRKPTTGDEWPPYTRDDPRYFIFNAKTSGLDVGPRLSDCAFWNEFLPRLEGVPGA